MTRQLTATKTSHEKWVAQGGRRGTGDKRRKGGKLDLYDGGKRDRQAFVICNCLHPVKETKLTKFLDSH